MNKERFNQLSKEIPDASITIHGEMGPGLLESVYELCLLKELQLRNIFVEQQVPILLFYKSEDLTKPLCIGNT